MMIEDTDFLKEMLKTMMPIEGEITLGEATFKYRIFLSKIKGKEHIIIAIPTEEKE